MKNKHLGSSLDSLLEETDQLTDVDAAAIKRVTNWEIEFYSELSRKQSPLDQEAQEIIERLREG